MSEATGFQIDDDVIDLRPEHQLWYNRFDGQPLVRRIVDRLSRAEPVHGDVRLARVRGARLEVARKQVVCLVAR